MAMLDTGADVHVVWLRSICVVLGIWCVVLALWEYWARGVFVFAEQCRACGVLAGVLGCAGCVCMSLRTP